MSHLYSDDPLLTSTNVDRVFDTCLGEAVSGAVEIAGVLHSFWISQERIEKNRAAIRSFLMQLPKEFWSDTGGGWSFLMACNRRDGEQWTGFHTEMEKLFVLGIAAGMVKELLPVEYREALPGGMPYYVIQDAKDNS